MVYCRMFVETIETTRYRIGALFLFAILQFLGHCVMWFDVDNGWNASFPICFWFICNRLTVCESE